MTDAHIPRADYVAVAGVIAAVGGIVAMVLHLLRLIWPGHRR